MLTNDTHAVCWTRRRARWANVAVAVVGLSCSGSSDSTPDSGRAVDALFDSGTDSGVSDTGFVDALTDDSGVVAYPRPGFGVISGACDELDDEIVTSTPTFFVNDIDFGTDPYDDSDASLLTEGGRRIIDEGNAGGSSLLSEVFAFEVLARCEDADLLKTETRIMYDTAGSLTDFLVQIDGEKIGVSVTRAVTFPRQDPFTEAQATSLLEGKLLDILESSANVAAEDRWRKQILHVIVYAPEHVASLMGAWSLLDPATRADTIVVATVSSGDDDFLY